MKYADNIRVDKDETEEPFTFFKPGEERIKLTDTLLDVMVKMSDGNPGAINAIMELTKINKAVDPLSAFGPVSTLLGLDSAGIYGTFLYVLFNDICERNPVKMIAVMRAVQLGIIPVELVKKASNRQDRKGKEMIDTQYCYDQVRLKLDGDFDPEDTLKDYA